MSATPSERPENVAADLPDDPRLMRAVQEFLDELEAGRRPSRQEFVRRYPDLAGPLAQCLDGLELVHKAAGGGRTAESEKRRAKGGETPQARHSLSADPLSPHTPG